MKREWLAAGAAFLLLAGACAPPRNTGNVVLVSPTPSPSPTPTAAFAAAGPAFHAGEVGVEYTLVTLTASGGVQPYHWSVAAGMLPPGLALGNDGTVSGTPTAAGHFTFTIQAADSGDSKGSIAGAVDVAAPLNASLLPSCAKYCQVELGCNNACGAFGSLSGGIGPYGYKVAQGPLPAGTVLSGLTLKGMFTGLSGYLQFTVEVSDAMGATDTIAPTFWMYPHVTLGGGTCGNPNSPGKCTVTLPYSGGTPGQHLAMAATGWSGQSRCGIGARGLPCEQPTMAVTFQPGLAVVTLTYGPNSPFTYGTLSVRLTSSDPCGAGASCTAGATITVNG